MEDTIEIRKLRKNDYNDILELEKQVHEVHYSHRPDLYNDVSELFPINYFYSIIDNKRCITLGIEVNNRIIAVIIAEIKDTSDISIIKKRKYCYIDDIIVDKNFRRKGYAKKLFNELKNQINTLNINDVELTVWPFNKEALLFYESLGMTVKNIKYELKNTIELNKEKIVLNTSQNVNRV